MKKAKAWSALFLSALILALCSCVQTTAFDLDAPKPVAANSSETASPDSQKEAGAKKKSVLPENTDTVFSLSDIAPYSGQAYVAVHDNTPFFTDEDLTDQSFESYADLDDLGRCRAACANIGLDIMPTGERGSIGHIKPTGWQTVRYDNVDGKYLYNRCHLIGYQLSGEDANERNLITGTRYLNVEGMLPFENMVADYVKETGNHVLYRVTPVFENDNLVASGVLMEAESVEDNGDGILFCVYVYNVQPGIAIDYATGESRLEEEASQGETYVLNTNSKKFHYPSCSSVKQIKEKDRKEYTGSRDDVIAQGYEPCKKCNP